MTVVYLRITTAVFLLLALCACTEEQNSTFDQERQAVQKTWSGEATLSRNAEVRRESNAIEASWDYEFAGNKEAAARMFSAKAPTGYKLIRQTDSEVALTRFDGNDSYYLTLSFAPTEQNSTTVSVLLRAVPD